MEKQLNNYKIEKNFLGKEMIMKNLSGSISTILDILRSTPPAIGQERNFLICLSRATDMIASIVNVREQSNPQEKQITQ